MLRYFLTIYQTLVTLSLYYCEIEINSRHKQSSLTFYHWNLNGIAAHDFVKILLIQGYITENNICLSETSQPANIGPQDATPTSPSNIPRVSPKNPIWPSRGSSESTSQGCPFKNVLRKSPGGPSKDAL